MTPTDTTVSSPGLAGLVDNSRAILQQGNLPAGRTMEFVFRGEAVAVEAARAG